MIELLQGEAFRDEVARLDGYDPAECGQIMELAEGLGEETV